jgi:hypothetical protein
MSSQQIARVRRLCLALPDTSERLSHGEPTFFVHNKVFVMFANNHHNDGHVAVWLPAPPGAQTAILESAPEVYFKPPYVGVRGWIGIELSRVSDESLSFHINLAWELRAPQRLLASAKPTPAAGKRAGKRAARRAAPARK